jgi:uncharacterized membrane protein YraQ (UPF0718 family)
LVSDIVIGALSAGLNTLLEYLSAHVLTCLIPAFFIAGAISSLLNKETVLKYFGTDAPKWLCYSVAATSGTILAVCSCTILPMDFIRSIFGTSSFLAYFVASIIGALLYMPTLLEVPIVGTLFGYSTGVTAPGPALSLLLAGPSLSLPSMIVIWRVIGARKAGVYIGLVVIVSTIVGVVYGAVVS